ncbi:MAG: hypothetical protein EP335_15190 [Alphaproteobacteria bacterium]|nr:MAG: hypothetical protein EP335_15190 [Alphaproteobacteria bacterium]
MGENTKDPKLADLEQRLSAARKKAEPEPENTTGKGSAMGVAFKMGIELVAGVAVGVLIGLTLDKWLATPPVFLFVFLIMGFAAGLRNVIREARKMQDQDADPVSQEHGKD